MHFASAAERVRRVIERLTHGVPTCYGTAVGVIVIDPDGRILLGKRSKPPFGINPPAGHVDREHRGSFIAAALDELRTEVGLHAVALEFETSGWLATRCRRRPARGVVGHESVIYIARVIGEVRAAPDEISDLRWYPSCQVQLLANHTVRYARGKISEVEFEANPGLEPGWVYWFNAMGVIHISDDDLEAVRPLWEGRIH